MKVMDIEKLASRNAPKPDGLSPPEQYLFLSLRALYGAYRNGTVEKMQAKKEKAEIISQYNELELYHRIYLHQSSMMRTVQRYTDKIKSSGCEVCKGLCSALCGIEDEPYGGDV